MVITREVEEPQVKIVVDAINAKMGGNRLVCPLSGHSDWIVERYFGKMIAVETLSPQENEQYSRRFPFVVLTCRICGFSFFVNVIRLGIAKELGIESAVEHE